MRGLRDDAGRVLGPAGRELTPEQAAAVARRAGSLLLSANAGSGKTSVLVERFVRSVLEDGLGPHEILAITFTDKAAGELRARIHGRFLELGRRDLARDAQAAWISTIHGFCARVLRAHAVAAGLDPAFEVLDEPAARALRRRAFDAALAGFLGDPAGPPRLDALDLAAAYTPDRLERMVLGVHEELRSRGQTRPALPAVGAADPVAARAGLEAAAREAAAELAAARPLASIDRARTALERCLADLAGLAPAAAPARGATKAWCFAAGQAGELGTEACERYLAAHRAYAQALVDAAAVPVVALVDELLGRFADAYAQAKGRRSALDFADLELGTRDLFARSPGIAAGYAERFARIMVDEFQDTNALQLDVLAHLDRDDLFVVGDEQQSIYGFRHADVGLFRARREQLAAREAAATLATNFRSRAEILEALNAAFGPGHGAGHVPLRAGRTGAPATEPLVELLVTDQRAWDEEATGEMAEAVRSGLPAQRASLAAEARLVAQRVRDLIDAGTCRARDVVVLLRAFASMGLFERALEAEGLATLASGGRGWWGRQQVQDLVAYLAALANPRDEEAVLGLLGSPLVGLSSDALALIALAARERGTSLWETLEAAFCPRAQAAARGGAATDALTADGGAAAEPLTAGPVAEPLAAEPDGPSLAARVPMVDAERLRDFCPRFQAERGRLGRVGLGELLERVVTATGYDLHVLGLPGGRRRLANVHKLMRLATTFEARRGRDLRGFVDHALAELEADAPEPDAPVDLGDDDAVRLMTIHAAKGLEFGVVVVAELGRQPNSSLPDLLVRDGEVGLRLIAMEGEEGKALSFKAIRQDLREAEVAEERRVMHVAMTRPAERLVLSGAAGLGPKWPKTGHGAAPLSWIGPELVPGIAEALRVEEPVVDAPAGGTGPPVRVVLNAPATARAVLRVPGAAVGEQLALALPGAAPVRPPATLTDVQPEPPRPATVPVAVSYSSLSRYAQCPYRFYLERLLGLPAQEAPAHLREGPVAAAGLDPLLRGGLVHQLLEGLDPAADRAPKADAVRELAAAHDAELTDDEVADLQAMVDAYLASALRERTRRAGGVRREQAFAFPLGDGGPMVTGFIDLLAGEADGTALVVDFKSDEVEGADLEALVERAYATQRRIYALACLRAGAPAVEVVHLFLMRPGEPAARRYEAGDAGALEAELRGAAAGVLGGEHPVAALPHRGLCATCPGRGSLCSWPVELTDRRFEDAVPAEG